MPVIWITSRGRKWDNAALAVPCSACGAFIGARCTAHYASDSPRDPHPQRCELAAEFGFIAVPVELELSDE